MLRMDHVVEVDPISMTFTMRKVHVVEECHCYEIWNLSLPEKFQLCEKAIEWDQEVKEISRENREQPSNFTIIRYPLTLAPESLINRK